MERAVGRRLLLLPRLLHAGAGERSGADAGSPGVPARGAGWGSRGAKSPGGSADLGAALCRALRGSRALQALVSSVLPRSGASAPLCDGILKPKPERRTGTSDGAAGAEHRSPAARPVRGSARL